jgi:hypothetical protein
MCWLGGLSGLLAIFLHLLYITFGLDLAQNSWRRLCRVNSGLAVTMLRLECLVLPAFSCPGIHFFRLGFVLLVTKLLISSLILGWLAALDTVMLENFILVEVSTFV